MEQKPAISSLKAFLGRRFRIIFFCLTLTIGGLSYGNPIKKAQAQQQCLTIQRGTYGTVADTKIADGSQSGKNYGDIDYFTIGYYASNRFHSLVKFGLEAIPAGSIINSTAMSLAYTNRGGLTINVHRVTAGWDEMTTTWNNFNNAYAPNVETSFSGGSGLGCCDVVDLTSLVQGWVNGTYPNYGILLESPDALPPEMYQTYRSSENSAKPHRPRLEVCYTPPCPSCPSDLTLDQEISDGRFNVQLRWNDVNYEEHYQIYRCEGASCSPSYLTTINSSPPLPSPLTYTDTNGGSGFEPGTTLRYEVRSCRSGCAPECRSCPGERKQITLPSCVCGPRQDVKCGGWTCAGEEIYQIQFCTWSDGSGLCDTNKYCVPDDPDDPHCIQPWFQTKEGDVHSQGDIRSEIPDIDSVFSLDGAGGSPGVVSYHGLTAYFKNGSISSTRWLAETSLPRKSYTYFYTLLGLGSPLDNTPSNDLNVGTITNGSIYYSEDAITLNGALPNGTKAVLLVGNGAKITINGNLTIAKNSNSSLVVVASGDIDIADSVSQVQGIFVADGELDTGSGELAFEGQGVFIANSVSLGRDFRAINPDDTRNASQPIEQFLYRPDLVLNTLPDLWFTKHTWREQAP